MALHIAGPYVQKFQVFDDFDGAWGAAFFRMDGYPLMEIRVLLERYREGDGKPTAVEVVEQAFSELQQKVNP